MRHTVGTGVWAFYLFHVVIWAAPGSLAASVHRSSNTLQIDEHGILSEAGKNERSRKQSVVMRSEARNADEDIVARANPIAGAADSVLSRSMQYMMWSPYVKPKANAAASVDKATKGGGIIGDAAAKAAAPVAEKVDEAANKVTSAMDALNPANKFCMVVNNDAKPPQIQVKKCITASSKESQFVLPAAGEVGPIKLKSDPKKCIGVPKEWWGKNRNYTPNALEISDCDSHVSEHNHTFLMPPVKNGTISGLIAWAEHPSMCIDLMDHEEKIKKIEEKGHEDGLLQLLSKENPTPHEAGPPEAKADDSQDEKAKENVREFEGNQVTLARCERLANWTLVATVLPNPAGALR